MSNCARTRSRSGPEIESPKQPDHSAERREWLANRPLAVSVAEFCRLTGLGVTSAYALIGKNKIAVRKIGRRTLVLTRSILDLIEGPAEDGGDQ